MAYYQIRCNLVSATFPFATELWGRTVMIPQMDFNYDRQAAAAIADYDKDKGIPQIYYAHNVMPTAQGMQSVGYTEVWPQVPNSTVFDSAIPILTSGQNRVILSPAGGLNYVADATINAWFQCSPFPDGAVPSNVQVTTAYVQGETYICYANYGIFTYDEVTKQLIPQASAGLLAVDIIAITTANNYLIAITETDVYWSSLLDPMDFTPSLTTGASSTRVADADGKLKFCLPISGGFMLYCANNVVGATYTGNIQFPFTLRPINGSGGVQSTEHVTWQAKAAEHYTITTNGLQKISRTESSLIFPELSDFLGARIMEDFNSDTLTFNQTYIDHTLYTHICLVTARYIVVSYGVNYNEFTHALVYDLSLKRWGKLKIDHVDCFQWNDPNLYGELTYDGLLETTYDDLGLTTYGGLDVSILNTPQIKNTIAFLAIDGTVKLVDFSLGNTNADGVLLLGKYQIVRNNLIKHLDTEVEVVNEGNNFTYYILPSLDGKTFLPAVQPMLVKTSPRLRVFMRQLTALNFSSLLLGVFNLVSFQIKVAPGPNR